MTPAETIAAAITKLTELRDASQKSDPGPWVTETHNSWDSQVKSSDTDKFGDPVSVVSAGSYAESDESWDQGTAQLVVTLHATIDAQLAILQHVLNHYQGDIGIGTNRHVVNLARVIVEAGA
jgi:hypothetical protein